MTSLIRIPFASSGDKTVVPETDAGGGVNMTQGYGQAYALDPATDPSAKRIEREKMNGLFNLITSSIAEIQATGCVPFITAEDNAGTAFSYGKGALTILDGIVYQSLVDGNTTTPPSSQWEIISGGGRLLNARIFNASGTYTPTNGTKSIIAEVQGGGGAGGGAAVTTGSNFSIGGGGLSGAYAKARITSLSASYSVVVGAGGTSVAGNAGNAGGNSAFGSVVTAAGGNGGAMLTEGTSFGTATAAGNYPSTDYAGANIYGSGCGYGQAGIRVSGTGGISGTGGSSVTGSGGGSRGSAGAGTAARGYGSAGGGAAAAFAGQSFAGGNGTPGVVIIWEFS